MTSLSEQVTTQEIFRSIKVEGSDTDSYLHSQLTCNVLEDFRYRKGLLLEPDGKLIDIVHLYRFEGGIEVVASARSIEEIESRLRRFLLRTKATIGEISQLNLYLNRDNEMILVPSSDDDSPLDEDELMALRLLNGDAARGYDYQEALFPNSLIDIDRYVSFTKGCYVGQEYVERTHSRGATAPKSLGIFGSKTPVSGAIVQGEVEVGLVLSGFDSEVTSIRSELKGALLEKFAAHRYLFFGLYSRRMNAKADQVEVTEGDRATLHSFASDGTATEVSRLN